MAMAPTNTESPEAERPAWGRWWGYGLLAVWAVVGVLGAGSLAVSHTAPMPGADDETRLVQAVSAHRTGAGRPLLVHVIAAGCSCTKRLFDHLVARGPFAGADELVVFVGNDPSAQKAAEARGFRFVTVTAEELGERYALESAPVLVVLDRDGAMRYVGGYFDNPAAVDPKDVGLYTKLAKGEPAEPLPVFGCAVSEELQRAVDPLGVVY